MKLLGLLMYIAGFVGSVVIMATIINAVVPHLLGWYVVCLIAVIVGGVLSKLEI